MVVLLFIFTVISTAFAAQECGQLAPNSTEFPWMAGIYGRRSYPPYLVWQNGGSLISNTVVLTAGHWFYVQEHSRRDKIVEDPETIAVAVGKLSRPWQPVKGSTQKSDVKEIHLSPRFRQRVIPSPVSKNESTNIPYFVNDIAIIIVTKAFRFTENVRPICLNFDYEFEQKQFQKDKKGLAMGWRPDRIEPLEEQSMLIIKDLYFVPQNECVESYNNDKLYSNNNLFTVTLSDKVCIQAKEIDSVPCRGDSGIGLVFPDDNSTQYYLFGVYSAPINFLKICQISGFYGFTSILSHESFIRRYWNESALDVFIPPDTGKCVLPPYPEFGTYNINVTRLAEVDADEGYVLVALTYTCREGYGVQGSTTVSCYNGFWPEAFPKCIRMCPVNEHPSVEYQCLLSGQVVGSRACLALEPAGTLVKPICRAHYYSTSALGFMRCGTDGQWDFTARCMQECGRLTPDGEILVVGGKKAQRGELPWHAGIYRKTTKPYMQICGGSLISTTHIISAAHCFWTDLDKQLPASQFAAAVGKLYRPWADKMDVDAQKSDVKEIHIPKRFGGAASSFQDDIAVVVVSEPFQFRTYVRPVCLNFDPNFDRVQLQTINKGKVAGWGLTGANGKSSGTLQVLELPYVEVGTCIDNSPRTFQEYITSDKICAGTLEESTALCKGDSGGGLAFASADRSTVRYYLRGVVSTAPNNDNACNTAVYTTFTQIQKHEDFIKRFLNQIY